MVSMVRKVSMVMMIDVLMLPYTYIYLKRNEY